MGRHLYYRDGRPCYQVIGKNGKLREPTIRDARSLSLLPSVTEITKLLPKPGLEIWKQEQLLYAALTLPRVKGETDEQLVARIKHDAATQAAQAARNGRRIHRSIELAFQGRHGGEYEFQATRALRYVKNLTGLERGWECEVCFAHSELGFGGKIDLVHRKEKIIIDFKTKESLYDKKGKPIKLGYPENELQLIGYGLGVFGYLKSLTTKYFNVFVDYDGNCTHKNYLDNGKRIMEAQLFFMAAYEFWCYVNNYHPPGE